MKYRSILGKLVARTAVHVGTGKGGQVTDDLCRLDAEGNYLIPGTAIGGALRTIATRLAPRLFGSSCRALQTEKEQLDPQEKSCPCEVCHLFGDFNPSADDTEEFRGYASRLLVAHAYAELPENLTPRIRDGVGIDRATRSSASKAAAKFDLEVLPKGTVLQLRLELEKTNENDERLLAATLAEWQAGRCWLGGRVARGLGAFDLIEIKLVERDLSTDEGLLNLLREDEPWKAEHADDNWLASRLTEAQNLVHRNSIAREFAARSFVKIEFDLSMDGPFLTNDTTASTRSGFDHTPLLDVMSQTGKPILPGASLRGALRSQAEKIARTLTTLDEDVNDSESFGKKCPACDPMRRREDENEIANQIPLASCDALLKNAEEEVPDGHLCLACRLFGNTHRGSRLIIEDAEAEANTPRKVLDFLAIDRFTGGGKEGAKFDALALWQPRFRVRMQVENPDGWELGWLALVLRDLAEGMFPVGFGGAKGFGRTKIESFCVNYGFITEDDFFGPPELANIKPSTGLYHLLNWDTRESDQKQELCRLAQKWVDEFNATRRSFKRGSADLYLKADTYFDDKLEIHKLYPKEAWQ